MATILIDGKTKLYGVIGNPVKHSFSPGMHSLAFQELGINAVYLPFLIVEEQLPQLLNAFNISGVQGFNITLPFKERIVPFLDSLSDEAEMLQSVNTVTRTDEGWKGYNTDGSGFIRSLVAANIHISGQKVLIVGAGGAARAIAVSMALAGVSEIALMNRTRSKAEDLSTLLYQIAPEIQVRMDSLQKFESDIIVNATSVGMSDGTCPVPDECLEGCQLVVDIIYNPAETTLLKRAAELSIPHMNGLDMLLYQGIEAFEIWTCRKAPVEIMRQSLVASVYQDSGPNVNQE